MKAKQMLEEVKKRLTEKHWNYSFKPHSWFFPSDAAPHDASFKYKCKRLYKLGLLERRGDSNARWGFSYRVPELKEEVK